MKLTDEEMRLLLMIPMTYDDLSKAMLVANVGTIERRNELRAYANKLRSILGV